MSSKRQGCELLDTARNFRATSGQTTEAVFKFLSSLDTPRSLTVWLLFKNQEHDQLVDLKCHPSDYNNNPYRFRLDYCATEFLSKATFLTKITKSKEQAALEKFMEYESLCGQTNSRFRSPSSDPLNNGSNVWLLNATKRKIDEILGDFSGDEWFDESNWGPGVSTLVRGEHVSAVNKFRDECGITRDLYPLVRDLFHVAYPSWSKLISARSEHDNGFSMQVGNKIVTVPKSSKTDRVIAIEPGINLWFQKGIGSMIRKRLLRAGVDLSDQTINQRLAKSGSRDQLLATVDFSSASDSISIEVVRELLPPRWFSILDMTRSRYGVHNGEIRKWNKFSSMGNGFTFELESLIFYASALAVRELTGSFGPVSVYGDDVIIPSASFDLYSSYSAFLGFRVNPKKSFHSGYFRESCGAHFYDGVNCKPIFLKEKLTYVESFYSLANRIRDLAHRHNSHDGCDSRFLDCWKSLLDRVPSNLRLMVPSSAGDSGFVGNFDESTPSKARYGHEGWFYRAIVSLGVTQDSEHFALLLARVKVLGPCKSGLDYPMLPRFLVGGPSIGVLVLKRDLPKSTQGYENSYTLRGRTKRKVVRPFVHQWYNFGQWQ